MRRSIDDAHDDHPADDDERPPVSWAVALADDCDACGFGELRVVMTVALTTAVVSHPSRADAQAKRPNIIVILTDDQRWDDLRYMPALGANPEFAHFTNSFVHEPQCCPS